MTVTARPAFSTVDDETADLLSLIAEPTLPIHRDEWDHYVAALHQVADDEGRILPNALRPLLRGHVAPNRIGAYTSRALRAGLVERTGEWQVSDDLASRNRGKPAPVMRLLPTDTSEE